MTAYWLALAGAIVTSLLGQVLLKLGANETMAAKGGIGAQLMQPATLGGLLCYGAAALLYIIALRRIPMSVALPSTAASYVAIALVGWMAFGEPLGTVKIAAIALIAVGVVLLATTA